MNSRTLENYTHIGKLYLCKYLVFVCNNMYLPIHDIIRIISLLHRPNALGPL